MINSELKYVRTGTLACLILQVKNQSKIVNYENIQKSKTSKSDFSKTWREKSQSMQDILKTNKIIFTA